jgi:anti-sigma regulatory factor (Ser/Thr protein kinase)
MNATNSIVEPFTHRALLYRGDAEYLDGVVPFIEDGIAAGEPVLVAVPPNRLELLRTKLGSSADAVRLLDMAEVGRNPGRLIAGVLLATADRHPGRRVRVVAEPVWPERSAEEYSACVQHEALTDRALTGRDLAMLCPYDAAGLGDAVLADAALTHRVLVDHTGTHGNDRYAPENAIAAHVRPVPRPADAETYVVRGADMTELRDVAATFAQRHGLDPARIPDLVLALTELASNSIEHAHSAATVLFARADGRLVCQVRDTGHIVDPLAGRRPAPPYAVRGRGLLLVNELADLVQVHSVSGATTIEIQFALHSSATDISVC